MTLVDVCGNCGTMFEQSEDHCRRCGADRRDAVQREMRELCYTYSGEEPDDDEFARMVKPIFQPRWGMAQWYEGEVEEPARDDTPQEDGGDEGTDEGP